MKKLVHNILHPTNIPNCKLWWEGDFTPNAGNVIDADGDDYVYSSIPNRGELGGDFSSATYKPLVSHLESGGFPRRVPYFTDGYQISSLAPSSWKFLHKEFTLVFVVFCADTGTIFSTFSDPSDSGIDIVLWKEADGGDITLYVGDGSGGVAINDSAHGLTDNILHVCSIRLAQTGYDVRIDQETKLEDVPAWPLTVDDPPDTLNIACRSGVTNQFTGNLIAAVAYDGYLALEQLEQIEYHFISKYGDQSVHVAQKPTFYFNIDMTPYGYHIDVENPDSGLYANRLADFSGNAHDAFQNTKNKQGKID